MIAIPYLYHNPFRTLEIWRSKEHMRRCRGRLLLRTLLFAHNSSSSSGSSNAGAQLHRALELQLEQDNATSYTATEAAVSEPTDANINSNNSNDNSNAESISLPPRPDLLKFVRHINLVQSTFMKNIYSHKNDNVEGLYTSEALDYIYGPDFLSACPMSLMYRHCYMHRDPKTVNLLMFPFIVDREAIWALSQPIFDRLESMTIPLSDIKRYQGVVERLSKVQRIHVLIDMVFDCFNCGYGQALQSERRSKLQATGQLLLLVKEHIQLFPGRLKDVTSSQPRGHHSGGPYAPADFNNLELFRMLPPAHRPLHISQINWSRIAVHPQTTDLGQVRYLDIIPPTDDCPQLLQRCRSLRNVQVTSITRPGCFDWAVRERRDLESLGLELVIKTPTRFTTTSTTNTTTQYPNPVDILGHPLPVPASTASPPQPAHLTHGLVPIDRFVMSVCTLPSQDLDDVVFAFSQTLQNLRIDDVRGPDGANTIHIGRDWVELPVLNCLEFTAQRHSLVLDPSLYAQSPLLKMVKILDETFHYRCEDIVPSLSSQLPELWSIYLKGWSALTFNPTILESTNKLVMLKLTMKRTNGHCSIPSLDELYGSYGLGLEGAHGGDEGGGVIGNGGSPSSGAAILPSIVRPRWTWDWDLPNLTDLDLTSEFAYLFQFKMLRGCPALETLRLLTSTIDQTHARTLSESDLFVHTTNEEGSQQPERIVVPFLGKLYMNGRWIIEDPQVLSQFISKMFPKLHRLTARGWVGNGATVGSMVKAIRAAEGRVWLAKTDLVGPMEKEGEELGVYPRSKENRKGPKTLNTRLLCSNGEYVLRKDQ
ncbi:hypothetical protein BGZ95_006901 [Linnemannia exigua]|uniref:Uncharacterized protein n=1 Tax=Linnemannia exigua TaxID=604196 RepID=A0AAD4DG17_9FUNG|nr:hypothetical protein BGZ95_006901 [Linnemannia exigua]